MPCARPRLHRAGPPDDTGRRPSSSARLRAVALGALLAIGAGCADSTSPVVTPESPPAGNARPPASSPPPPSATEFPPVAGAATVYAGAESIYGEYASYHGGSLLSRFVLDDEGTFRLQFLSPRFGFFEYRGRYARSVSRITFEWEGWSTAGPWGATGTLAGDILRVEYNLVMQMTDFIDGQYVRVPATP